MGANPEVTRKRTGTLHRPRAGIPWEIICGSLDRLGSPARAVRVSIPTGLPGMMADPAIMERVVANVTANALRYSPPGSSPLLTASARGDRVELRVVDRGPGVPEHDSERMLLPWMPASR